MTNNVKDPTPTNEKMVPKKSKRSIFNTVLVILLSIILLAGATGFYTISHVVGKLSKEDRNPEEKIVNIVPTTVYAKNNEIIYELGAESREIVKYEQIPQVTIDAFLAIEDSRFFKHNGFDLPRFLASAMNNLKHGNLAQGGSTLTMQTIDNFIIKTREEKMLEEGHYPSKLEKIEMKIQEIYLSLHLDAKMDKKDILLNYLNKVNFGASARGIQKGSQYYFGKNVEELNLSESAFLAGVVNAPGVYNPYIPLPNPYDPNTSQNYYQLAMKRRDNTLSQMLNHGYITEAEYKLAKSTKLSFQLEGEEHANDNPYLAYAKAAIDEAAKITGVDPATTPLHIYTNLDVDTQKRIHDIQLKKVITMPENEYFQMASSVIDNKTGAVIAIGTGFDDPTSSTYIDRAMKDIHQPASTAKPLIAYGPAFDKLGWATSRIVEDKPIKLYGEWKVNYNNEYYGKIPIERAIAQSLNIPAIETLKQVTEVTGNDYMRDYMRKLGFKDNVADKFDLLYAIGGANFTATPTEMAAAYATLANGGLYKEPYLVERIEYKDGSKTWNHQAKTQQTMSPQAAYMTSDLLYKAVTGKYSGWNFMSSAFSGCGYPVYGKTGTSDWDTLADQAGGMMKDGWMINYTSDYTVATWNGFDHLIPGYSYISDSVLNMNIPGQINRYILDPLSANATKLERPDGISSYGGGLIKTEFLKDASKNNPETVENVTLSSDKIKKLLKQAAQYNKDDYTEESWQALQNVIDQLNKLVDEDYVKDEKLSDLKNALNNAISQLQKAEQKTDTSALTDAINRAKPYTDSSRYDHFYVSILNMQLNHANDLLLQSDPSKEEMNEVIANIDSAIQDCIDHPKECHGPNCDDEDD